VPSRKSTKPADSATQVQALSIDKVHTDPANARRHPERNKATIRASLARFGAGRSIVVDKNNVVRAGNGTIEEARASGFDEILIVEPKPNQLVAVKRPDWSDTEATAYSVQDNRSTDLSCNDDAALAATLEAVRNDDASLLEATGYTGDEVDLLLQSLAGELVDDPQGEWQGMPEFVNPDQNSYHAIRVHFKDDESIQAFAALVGQPLNNKSISIWYPKEEKAVFRNHEYGSPAEVSDLHSH
jgi:hypothetical protein